MFNWYRGIKRLQVFFDALALYGDPTGRRHIKGVELDTNG